MIAQTVRRLPGALLALALALVLAGACLATPALAQVSAAEAAQNKLDDMIAAERDMVHAAPVSRRCPDDPQDGTIVVCAPDHSERWRVPSTADENPRSAAALNTGIPRAPRVTDLVDCSDPANGCHGFGHVPPPVYYIDVTKLPAPPPGSDADKIARGEMPAP
jgi:hypothetical protein